MAAMPLLTLKRPFAAAAVPLRTMALLALGNREKLLFWAAPPSCAGKVALKTPGGVLQAVMTVKEVYPHDKKMMILEGRIGDSSTIPEPTTAVMLLLGLVGLSLGERRTRAA